MKRSRNGARYVVCVANRGYRASLVVRRLYRLISDREAEQRGLVRVIDESGEDYLYPKKMFAVVDLPSALTKKFAVANLRLTEADAQLDAPLRPPRERDAPLREGGSPRPRPR